MVCSSSLSLAIPCLRNIAFEGETRALPEPFFVIATQNSLEQSGIHPLPESQLDRFLMRMELGYPDAAAERGMLQSMGRSLNTMRLRQCLNPQQLASIRIGVFYGGQDYETILHDADD